MATAKLKQEIVDSELKPKERLKLDKFRTAVEDLLRPNHDDYFLLRWLRARSFDVAEAEAMFRTCIQWREQFGMDSLIEEFECPEVLVKYFPFGFTGHDKEGCPVVLIPIGSCDFRGLLYSVKKSDFIKHVLRLLEMCEQDMQDQSELLGKVIENHVCIVDVENLSLKQLTFKPAVDFITHMVTMYEDNYPERLKKAYIINATKLWFVLYAIIKPFLSEETAKKIVVYGKGTWKKALLEDIEASQLPAQWGGDRTDDDGNPACPSIVCPGGPVPCSYYMAPSRGLAADANLQLATVEKKSIFPVSLEVEHPGSKIRWTFQTENYDVGFGVFFRGPDQKEDTVVLPSERVNCHLVPEDGTVTCQQPGTYILKFDNTFSWCRSKKLMYEVQVVPPEKPSSKPSSPVDLK